MTALAVGHLLPSVHIEKSNLSKTDTGNLNRQWVTSSRVALGCNTYNSKLCQSGFHYLHRKICAKEDFGETKNNQGKHDFILYNKISVSFMYTSIMASEDHLWYTPRTSCHCCIHQWRAQSF